MEEDIDYLSGQIDALTKLCATLVVHLMVTEPKGVTMIKSFVSMLSNDLNNTDLSRARIQGIDAVRNVLQNVLRIPD